MLLRAGDGRVVWKQLVEVVAERNWILFTLRGRILRFQHVVCVSCLTSVEVCEVLVVHKELLGRERVEMGINTCDERHV
jgi:hypothetical protein